MLVKKSVVCHKIHHGSLGEEEGWEMLRGVSSASKGLAPMVGEGVWSAQCPRSCSPARCP